MEAISDLLRAVVGILAILILILSGGAIVIYAATAPALAVASALLGILALCGLGGIAVLFVMLDTLRAQLAVLRALNVPGAGITGAAPSVQGLRSAPSQAVEGGMIKAHRGIAIIRRADGVEALGQTFDNVLAAERAIDAAARQAD